MTARFPIAMGGANWACDGYCAIREGRRLPKSDGLRQWLDHLAPSNVAALLAWTRRKGRPLTNERCHIRFRSLVKSAHTIDVVEVRKVPMLRLRIDGVVVAIIATYIPICVATDRHSFAVASVRR